MIPHSESVSERNDSSPPSVEAASNEDIRQPPQSSLGPSELERSPSEGTSAHLQPQQFYPKPGLCVQAGWFLLLVGGEQRWFFPQTYQGFEALLGTNYHSRDVSPFPQPSRVGNPRRAGVPCI